MRRDCRACGAPTGRPPRAFYCEPCAEGLRKERELRRGRGRYKTLSEAQRLRRRAYANEYAKRRAIEHPEKVAASARASYRRAYDRGAAIVCAAKSTPCVDCGIVLPSPAMDLDHVRGEKAFSVAQWFTAKRIPGLTRIEALEAEIAKCEVRCPNCHRMRHLRERESE